MGRLAILTILAVLISADAAAARSLGVHPRMGGHMRAPHIRAPRLGHTSHRHGRRIRLSASAVRASALDPRTEFVRHDEGLGDTAGPGWVKSGREAGWGMKQGGTKLVAGLYQRPVQPDIPGPQMRQDEGRGAAGLSLSLKLGQ